MITCSLRECEPGDKVALSLVALATILETYAAFVNSENLYRYISEELSAEAFRKFLAKPVNTRVGSGDRINALHNWVRACEGR